MFGPGIFRVLLKKPWGYFLLIIILFIFFLGGGGGWGVPSFDHSRQLKSGVPLPEKLTSEYRKHIIYLSLGRM